MLHTFGGLEAMAEDCWPAPFSQQDWERIANFAPLQAEWQQARQDRLPLLAAQREGFTRESEGQLNEIVARLRGRITDRISSLENQDLQSLRQQQALCRKRLEGITNELRAIIGDTLHKARTETLYVSGRLSEDIARSRQLQSHTGYQLERYSYEVSNSTWYKPWTWGSSRTEYGTTSVAYQYFNAQDAIEQIRQYSRNCASQIRQHFNHLIEPVALKKSLRSALVNHLNTNSEQFDPALFRGALESAIHALSLPELVLEADESQVMIPFQGEIKSSEDKQKLQQALDRALGSMFDKLAKQLDAGAQSIFDQLETLKSGLQETLSKSLQQEFSEIEQGLARKESETAAYRELLRQLG